MRDETDTEQERGVVIGAEEPDRQKDAGGEDLHGDGGRSPVRDTEAEVHPADAGELGAEVDMRNRVRQKGRERDGREAGA
jgi:hypothetical protein